RRKQLVEGEIEDLRGREARTAEDLRQAEEAAGALRSSEGALADSLARAEAEDRDSGGTETPFGAELDRVRQLCEEARRERDRVSCREQEGKLKRNALVEKIADEYGLDLAEIAAQGGLPAPSATGSPAGPEAAPAPAPTAPPTSAPAEGLPAGAE